jgi:hypothetical protein
MNNFFSIAEQKQWLTLYSSYCVKTGYVNPETKFSLSVSTSTQHDMKEMSRFFIKKEGSESRL